MRGIWDDFMKYLMRLHANHAFYSLRIHCEKDIQTISLTKDRNVRKQIAIIVNLYPKKQ